MVCRAARVAVRLAAAVKTHPRSPVDQIDDRALLHFFMQRVLGSGPSVRRAVIDTWSTAREAGAPTLLDVRDVDPRPSF
jgi:hypothetical protein